MAEAAQETSLANARRRPLAGKRLGIICSVPAARQGNRLLINHAIGRLLDALVARVPGTKLCIPILPAQASNQSHAIEIPPEDVTTLPPLASVMKSQRYHFQTCRAIRNFVRDVDVLFVRVPFQVPVALRKLRKPKLMHVISNPRDIIRASDDYRGPMRFLAQRFANHSVATMRRMAAEPATRVASNGREMYDLLQAKAGRVVVSSCLYEHEMQPRTDLRLQSPPRILFVGYLRPEKGIHTLLDAFERIRRRREIKLTIVGGVDKVTSRTESQVRARLVNSPFAKDIELLGMLDFGETLFDLYRGSDVYVLPSLSEGTPRTLIEARAFGCPVVATRVGGIPSSVDDGRDGLLIEPNDPAQLAETVERVLDDEPLRRSMIEQGLVRSRRHSLEAFADELVEELEIVARDCRAAQD